MSEERKVYIVETSDDLLESWFPMGVYLQREAAENCAETLRHDDGYIRSVARVIEMKVADTGECQMDTDGLDSGHVRNSSAYEAGYRDGSMHYELDHCPACKNIADLQEALEENAKLREAVATAIKVQAVLCRDADSMYCRKECPLHRQESDDCLACDVIVVAQELGIEVDE